LLLLLACPSQGEELLLLLLFSSRHPLAEFPGLLTNDEEYKGEEGAAAILAALKVETEGKIG